MNLRLGAVAVLAAALAASPLAPSAEAADGARTGHRQHYGESFRHVAREIGCGNIFVYGALTGYHDAGRCDIAHERVTIITFTSAAQERRFTRHPDFGGPRYWWVKGAGAIVLPVGRSEHDAAQEAARRLPGDLRHGG